MEKQIIIALIIFVSLISLTSATTIIAGNQEITTLDVSPSSCIILDSQNNSLTNYSLDGLNFTIDENRVTINTHPALKPDNYTLICNYSWTEETEESGGNGGGSSGGGGGCLTTWECTEWGDCVNGNQTRICSKVIDYCYAPKKDKPIEEQGCSIIDNTTISDDGLIIAPKGNEEKGFFLWRFFRWLWDLLF